MNKKRYLILTLILSLLCMNKVYATCTQTAKEEFKKLEKQYRITTIFNSKDKTYNMKIEEADSNKFDYVFTTDYQYECKKINDNETECYGLKPGTSFYANIVGKTNQCNEVVKEELIKLANYNKFYGDPLCEGIEEFVLCQEIYDRVIDRETFEERIALYKKDKESKPEEEEPLNQDKSFIDKTISYVKQNLIQVIIVVIFIVLVITSLIVGYKLMRKSRRFE